MLFETPVCCKILKTIEGDLLEIRNKVALRRKKFKGGTLWSRSVLYSTSKMEQMKGGPLH